jgi:hypothetical protein
MKIRNFRGEGEGGIATISISHIGNRGPFVKSGSPTPRSAVILLPRLLYLAREITA